MTLEEVLEIEVDNGLEMEQHVEDNSEVLTNLCYYGTD